jgi:hypothetical protein
MSGPGEDEALIPGVDRIPPDGFDDCEPPAGLREEVLRATLSAVRRRPRRRRAAACVAFLAVFAVGVAAGRLLLDGPRPAGIPATPPGFPGAAGPATRPPASAPRGAGDVLAEDAAALLAAVPAARPVEKARLLRKAGDAFLERQGDVGKALDCYRQVLEITAADGTSPPAESDTWLLASLKKERMEPKR